MKLQDRYDQVLQQYPDAPERYELTVKEVYSEILTEGATALDLGAHTGKHALPLGRVVGATGRIYAFEPILDKFKALSDNIKNAGLTQISPFNVCCLDENKIVTFTYLPTDPGKSAIHIRKSLDASVIEKVTQECLAIRLDDFFVTIDASPQFIKIDIEGAELMALRGARSLINTARPILHIEIGPPSLEAFGVHPRSIYDFLEEMEYGLMDIFGIPISNVETYLESVAATGLYDYIAYPLGDTREKAIATTCRQMWKI